MMHNYIYENPPVGTYSNETMGQQTNRTEKRVAQESNLGSRFVSQWAGKCRQNLTLSSQTQTLWPQCSLLTLHYDYERCYFSVDQLCLGQCSQLFMVLTGLALMQV